MKILVYPHDLGMGGSQLNAIEMAASVRDRGHDVAIYGRPGVLNGRIRELGLEFIKSPRPSHRPTPWIAADLRRIIGARDLDIVHGYEWPPIIESRIASIGSRCSVIGTQMSMAVAPFIPRDLPLVVGTRQIAKHEMDLGRKNVAVIEPPIDLTFNRPSPQIDVDSFRASFDIPTGLQVVAVSRLANELKLEGLLVAIEQTPHLGPDVVLTIVGDGPARRRIEEAATASNRLAARRAVVVTGELADPRPAYAMADISLGMGGSALRAMAFGAPLVVQGEQGFWQPLTPETLSRFQWTGWYGVGEGAELGRERFLDVLRPLVHDHQRRVQLGQFAQDTVLQHYSLTSAAARQEQMYYDVRRFPSRAGPRRSDGAAMMHFLAFKAAQRRHRRAGTLRVDDLNAHPVAALPNSVDVGRETSWVAQ